MPGQCDVLSWCKSVGVCCSAVTGDCNSVPLPVGAGGNRNPDKFPGGEISCSYEMHDESVINKRDVCSLSVTDDLRVYNTEPSYMGQGPDTNSQHSCYTLPLRLTHRTDNLPSFERMCLTSLFLCIRHTPSDEVPWPAYTKQTCGSPYGLRAVWSL